MQAQAACGAATIDGKLSNLGDSWFQFTVAVGESGLGGAVAAALDVPIRLLDAATVRIKGAQLDLHEATTADIALLERVIELNKQTIQPRTRSGRARLDD